MERGEFNHFNFYSMFLTLPLTHGPNSLIKYAQHVEYLIHIKGDAWSQG